MGRLSQNQRTTAAPKGGGHGVCRSRYDLGEGLVVEHGPSPGERPVSETGVILMPPLGYQDTYGYRFRPRMDPAASFRAELSALNLRESVPLRDNA